METNKSITHVAVVNKGILLEGTLSATQTSQTSSTIPLNQQTLKLQKNGNFDEGEKIRKTTLVPHFMNAAPYERSTQKIRKETVKPHSGDGCAAQKVNALTRLEITPQRLRGNASGFHADQPLYDKFGEQWKNAAQKEVNVDCSRKRNNMRSKFRSTEPGTTSP